VFGAGTLARALAAHAALQGFPGLIIRRRRTVFHKAKSKTPLQSRVRLDVRILASPDWKYIMPLIRPFAALRPAADRASDVIAPPYDVLSSAEARVLAEGRPWSFLHVSKPEIDLPAEIDPYSAAAYAKAAESLAGMISGGVLRQDPRPMYYAYRLIMGEHRQLGLVAAASVAEYDRNRIRRHEFTRPDKEDDRVRQIEAVNAQTGPVLLAYPDCPELDQLLADATELAPDADAESEAGVRHTLWAIRDETVIARISARVDALSALYIADGHHRAAAASRVAAARRAAAGAASGEQAYDYFLTVSFPAHQMKILDYNRVIRDLHGLTPSQFLDRVSASFSVAEAWGKFRPARAREFGLYLDGKWHRLQIRPDLVPEDPVGRLDVSLLQNNLIAPILGISDPRRDTRIDFVGGIRGIAELEKRVNSGEMALALALYPTSMVDLMSVADAGEVMPPKSTWFEPKLRDGLLTHLIYE
jgi:uncharacterized protein (DUF1015 family)